MKNFKKLAGIGAAAVAALSFSVLAPAAHASVAAPVAASASPSGGANDMAVPDTLGAPWQVAQMTAYSGGGCAGPQTDSNLSPIVSIGCGTWNWYWRSLGTVGTGGDTGIKIEFVDPSGDEAFGFSGGHFKLETPNADTTYIVFRNASGYCTGNWCLANNSGYTNFAAPNGKGLDLNTPSAGTNPNDTWEY